MSRIGTSLLIFILILMTGCATAPVPVPSFAISPGSKVGLLVSLPSSPVHLHIGTTVFNNFTKPYELPETLDASATNRITTRLRENGFQPVDLKPLGWKISDVNALAKSDGQHWVANPDQLTQLNRLRNELGLRAIVVMTEARVSADLGCAGGPCSDRQMERSGLFSLSFLNISRFRAVAAMEMKVFILDPAVELSSAQPLKSQLELRVLPLAGFKEPADYKNLTPAEFAPVVNWIHGFIDEAAASTAKALRNGAK
ncbi:MAG: hypothetical protein H7315_14075 [Herminiimonas sp.]|nr:hypothetical protein [Herminiimonas sp.]